MELSRRRSAILLVCPFLIAQVATTFAQERSAEDEAIDTIRRLSDIASQDQQRIKDWVQVQVDRLAKTAKPPKPEGVDGAAVKAFRERFRAQLGNPANTPQFKSQLAAQTATVAVSELGKDKIAPSVAAGLVQVLVDSSALEALPGLIAGLRAKAQPARYLAARGLGALKTPLAADKDKLAQVIKTLRDAGLVETSAPVLARIYEALAFPGQTADVVDDYLALFDRRLAERRKGAVREDGAELPAYEFFRASSVIASLTPEQKAELVKRLATFLRFAAERYNDPALAVPSDPNAPDVSFYEREDTERALDAIEEILQSASGAPGGKIRDELNTNGWDGRATVLREAQKWYGEAAGAKTALNEAPWGVPQGAP